MKENRGRQRRRSADRKGRRTCENCVRMGGGTNTNAITERRRDRENPLQKRSCNSTSNSRVRPHCARAPPAILALLMYGSMAVDPMSQLTILTTLLQVEVMSNTYTTLTLYHFHGLKLLMVSTWITSNRDQAIGNPLLLCSLDIGGS